MIQYGELNDIIQSKGGTPDPSAEVNEDGLNDDDASAPRPPLRPISIVIPAHDEAGVIARALRAITTGARPRELDVVVVCNGCTDDTARIARNWGNPVRVVETATASKTAALNLGDGAAGALFPRFYVDADVVISLASIRRLAARLERGDVCAVAPSPALNLSDCSWLVRWFHQVALLLPAAREGIGGSGVYGLSGAGRARFRRFPDVVADDAFVRQQFEAGETATLTGATAEVFPPRHAASLVRTRTRIRFGHLELARQFPAQSRRRETNDRALLALFAVPALWPKLIVYTVLTLIARRLAARRFKIGLEKWEHDQTSRAAAARPG
jgi:glycosyltransferase involved in cell wall biosynthesis